MFLSNQIFNLSGSIKDNKVLKNVVSLLLNGFDFKPTFYSVKNGELFITSQYQTNDESFNEISRENCNVDYITQMIQLYFYSSEYKERLRTVNSIYENSDGSTYPGWEINICNSGFIKYIVIKPFWCFYHK